MSAAACGPHLKSLLIFYRFPVDASTGLLAVTPVSAWFGGRSGFESSSHAELGLCSQSPLLPRFLSLALAPLADLSCNLGHPRSVILLSYLSSAYLIPCRQGTEYSGKTHVSMNHILYPVRLSSSKGQSHCIFSLTLAALQHFQNLGFFKNILFLY